MLLLTWENFIVPSALQEIEKTYETIILSVVLYGCETWSLTLREEHRLMVFENKVDTKEDIWGQETKLQENGESYIMLS